MNILLIHPHDIYSTIEPWTIRIVSCAREFVKMGHTVKLVYFPRLNDKNKVGVCTYGIEVIAFDRRPGPHVLLMNIKRMCTLAGWSDVVHFQKCFYWASLPALCAAYLANKPLHYDWDDWEEKIWYESCGKGLHSRFIGLFFKLLERVLPVLSDSVSCASSRLKEIAVTFGMDEEYIFDSPVGADTEKFFPDIDSHWVREKYGIAADEKLALYIGQLHSAQHVDLFIKGANIVLHRQPRVKFMIVGEGFLECQLKQLVHTLGLEEKVIFTGAVDHDMVPAYICAADVCVAPFRDTEVTRCKSPLKIAEYMACGKAIVASNVGEVRKMLGGIGVLVEPGDCYDLTEGILKVINDEALGKKLGKAARFRAERKFNWSHTAANLLQAYRKIGGVG